MNRLSRVVNLKWGNTADLWARLCVEGYVSRYLYERSVEVKRYDRDGNAPALNRLTGRQSTFRAG